MACLLRSLATRSLAITLYILKNEPIFLHIVNQKSYFLCFYIIELRFDFCLFFIFTILSGAVNSAILNHIKSGSITIPKQLNTNNNRQKCSVKKNKSILFESIKNILHHHMF